MTDDDDFLGIREAVNRNFPISSEAIREAVNRNFPIDADQVKQQFAKHLRAHRRAKGLTQADLSQQSGVSQRAISNYEGGTATPNLHQFVLLQRVLELAPAAYPPSWTEPVGPSPVENALRRLRQLRTELDMVIDQLADHAAKTTAITRALAATTKEEPHAQTT